ncbi:MAG: hypothetical protein SPL00_04455 [Bacilli bacterium]|nr:hypothetical protein [Bacilli bacterium]
MNKRGLLLAGSLLSLSAVVAVTLVGFKTNGSLAFANRQQTNAEYTISTWEFDGWCKNAGIYGYGKQGRVFMFHSSSNGAGEGVKVRSDVKFAIILSQMTYQDDIIGDMDFTEVNGMPSLVCNDRLNYVKDELNNPVWPANYMAIYTVQIMIGDFTFDGDEDSGVLTEKNELNNFVLKSFFVNATLTYCTPGDEQPGNWERHDLTYVRTFTQTETQIGDYEGQSHQPHVGFKVDSLMVTYGCSY